MLLGIVKDVNHGVPTHLCFESIELGSLYHLLHEREHARLEFDVIEICKIARDISEALHYLHVNKWAHNAVSTHAIHMVGPHNPKLGDLAYMNKVGIKGANAKTNGIIPEQLWRWLAPEAFIDSMNALGSSSGHRHTGDGSNRDQNNNFNNFHQNNSKHQSINDLDTSRQSLQGFFL